MQRNIVAEMQASLEKLKANDTGVTASNKEALQMRLRQNPQERLHTLSAKMLPSSPKILEQDLEEILCGSASQAGRALFRELYRTKQQPIVSNTMIMLQRDNQFHLSHCLVGQSFTFVLARAADGKFAVKHTLSARSTSYADSGTVTIEASCKNIQLDAAEDFIIVTVPSSFNISLFAPALALLDQLTFPERKYFADILIEVNAVGNNTSHAVAVITKEDFLALQPNVALFVFMNSAQDPATQLSLHKFNCTLQEAVLEAYEELLNDVFGKYMRNSMALNKAKDAGATSATTLQTRLVVGRANQDVMNVRKVPVVDHVTDDDITKLMVEYTALANQNLSEKLATNKGGTNQGGTTSIITFIAKRSDKIIVRSCWVGDSFTSVFSKSKDGHCRLRSTQSHDLINESEKQRVKAAFATDPRFSKCMIIDKYLFSDATAASGLLVTRALGNIDKTPLIPLIAESSTSQCELSVDDDFVVITSTDGIYEHDMPKCGQFLEEISVDDRKYFADALIAFTKEYNDDDIAIAVITKESLAALQEGEGLFVFINDGHCKLGAMCAKTVNDFFMQKMIGAYLEAVKPVAKSQMFVTAAPAIEVDVARTRPSCTGSR